MWMLRPDQAVDVARDVCVLSARRSPTVVSKGDFQDITGETAFPHYLHDDLDGDSLQYHCNTLVNYALDGINVKLSVLWNVEASAGGGDTHLAVFRGTRSRVEVRQGREEKYQPELYVIPNKTMEHPLVRRAIDQKIQALHADIPGIGVIDLGTHF